VKDPDNVSSDLWHTFIAKHRVGETDQEAFLDYLTRPGAPSAESLEALEEAYRRFLRQGPPSVDIH
jgi:hypothetical protein